MLEINPWLGIIIISTRYSAAAVKKDIGNSGATTAPRSHGRESLSSSFAQSCWKLKQQKAFNDLRKQSRRSLKSGSLKSIGISSFTIKFKHLTTLEQSAEVGNIMYSDSFFLRKNNPAGNLGKNCFCQRTTGQWQLTCSDVASKGEPTTMPSLLAKCLKSSTSHSAKLKAYSNCLGAAGSTRIGNGLPNTRSGQRTTRYLWDPLSVSDCQSPDYQLIFSWMMTLFEVRGATGCFAKCYPRGVDQITTRREMEAWQRGRRTGLCCHWNEFYS